MQRLELRGGAIVAVAPPLATRLPIVGRLPLQFGVLIYHRVPARNVKFIFILFTCCFNCRGCSSKQSTGQLCIQIFYFFQMFLICAIKVLTVPNLCGQLQLIKSIFSWAVSLSQSIRLGWDSIQGSNQLGTPGGVKSFPRGAQMFSTMSNIFKLCPTHFSRGGEKCCRGDFAPSPRHPWLRALLHHLLIKFRKVGALNADCHSPMIWNYALG